MKISVSFFVAVLFSVAAFSANGKVNMTCVTKDETFVKTVETNQFSVLDVLGKSPASDIPDTSLMNPPELVNGQLDLVFSNECDNLYSLSISEQALNEVTTSGTAKTIVIMKYVNANIETSLDDPRSATFRCTLVQSSQRLDD